ncbi:MAG: hypothetical protein R3F20_03250 [Planctomycetota bacterium]
MDWKDIRLEERGGALARVWFRRLASDFWGTLLKPRWYHTWIEIVTPDDQGLPEGPLSLGIYDKDVDGDRRALLMSQHWEYEPEQLARYEPGHLTIALPGFAEADLAFVHRVAREGHRENLGPYAFLCAWNDLFDDEKALNCMSWMSAFVRARGGPEDVQGRVEEAFRRHLERLGEGGRLLV